MGRCGFQSVKAEEGALFAEIGRAGERTVWGKADANGTSRWNSAGKQVELEGLRLINIHLEVTAEGGIFEAKFLKAEFVSLDDNL